VAVEGGWLFANHPGDDVDGLAQSRFHHKDARHRLTRTEPEVRGEILGHHRWDLGFPEFVQDKLRLP